jgi:hypothetical protein
MIGRAGAAAAATWVLVTLAGAGTLTFADERSLDQTFAVEEGASLDLEALAGEVVVRIWDRDQVQVRARHGAEVEVEARELRGDVAVRSVGKESKDVPVDYDILVPRWLDVRIRGKVTDVDIRGTEGEIDAQVIDGDITVIGGREDVFLRSVHGSIDLERAEGHIDVESTNEDVNLIDCRGEILAETINGDLRLENIDSKDVEGTTVTGDIQYDGVLDGDGNYYFTTHGGDVEITIPGDADLTVNVTTFRGELENRLPAGTNEQRNGREATIVLGDGRGQLRVESFLGDVALLTPKEGRVGKHGR